MRLLAVIIAAAALQACAGGLEHHTASGKPEVTIRAAGKDVKIALVGTLANVGYTLRKDTDFQIVAERPIDNALATLLLSSKYDPTVEARFTATVMPMGQETRVMVDLGIVRNGGSAFEAVTPMNNSAESGNVQLMLDDLRAAFAEGKQVAEVVAVVSQNVLARRAKS